MLRRLKIENFVLVKTCDVEFSSGFNIITGETGSGKSVLLSALQLLLGARADADSIRHGDEIASIEGIFFHDTIQQLQPLIDEYEIELTDEYTIRREIHRNGKHKSYINGHIVPTALIKSLAPYLLDHYDHETCFQLKSTAFALKQLDLFAKTQKIQDQFQQKWTSYKSQQTSYAKLLAEEQFREIELEQLKREITALESLQLHDLNDEALFTTYQQGLSQQKIEEELHRLSECIDHVSSGLLSKVKQACILSKKLPHPPITELLESASISIQEASYYLERQMNVETPSKEQLAAIEKKLTLYDSLKRKYVASTKEELQNILTNKKQRREDLLKRDEYVSELKKQIESGQKELDTMALCLSEKRKTAAMRLQSEIESCIRLMQMPQATFQITLEASPRSASGDDCCSFSFVPNPGEKLVNVHTGASNGELARIFLALSATVSSQENKSTILFDEIDANIGGMTARTVGHLLKTIAKDRQVLAITHFPQVSESADCHFVLSKEVIGDRTLSSITKLSNAQDLKKEHRRMAGKA